MILIFVCRAYAQIPWSESEYFKKFYKPGSAQKLLEAKFGTEKQMMIAQNTPHEEELDLDAPALEAAPLEQGTSIGPFSNINFGGTLDYRFLFGGPDGLSVPRKSNGDFMIHVNELFLTTNIGDNISILAEQLLVTSDIGVSEVGQDHGFVYAIFSNLPWSPESWSIKLGRLRLKYGIDAEMDAPANPSRTPVYKTIGFITDKAIELSGYFGPVEYYLGVANGADNVTESASATGSIKVASADPSKPFFGRLKFELSDDFYLGTSFFYGSHYPVTSRQGFTTAGLQMGYTMDKTRLVDKIRGSLDAQYRLWKFYFSGEYTLGQDKDGGDKTVQNGYGRVDYTFIPQKLKSLIQYNYFNDGRSSTKDFGIIGAGLTYYISDQSWLRLVYEVDDLELFRGGNKTYHHLTSQLLLAF